MKSLPEEHKTQLSKLGHGHVVVRGRAGCQPLRLNPLFPLEKRRLNPRAANRYWRHLTNDRTRCQLIQLCVAHLEPLLQSRQGWRTPSNTYVARSNSNRRNAATRNVILRINCNKLGQRQCFSALRRSARAAAAKSPKMKDGNTS